MKKLLLPVILLFPLTTIAETASLFTCRQIEDIKVRVVCYDKIVDSLFPLADNSMSSESPSLDESGEATLMDAQSLFGKNSTETKRIVQKTLAIKEIKQITANVVQVKKSAYKKLTVTLDNGQVWRQIDSKPLPLRSGETIIVRAALLGSFLMEKQSGGVSIRVKRLN